MDNKLDEATVAAQAAMRRHYGTTTMQSKQAQDFEALRAGILAGMKVLLGPLAAEWRATASDLYFPDDSDCCARGRIEVENGTLKDCADRLESIYAPGLGEGDGR